jgi:hypothetical protein
MLFGASVVGKVSKLKIQFTLANILPVKYPRKQQIGVRFDPVAPDLRKPLPPFCITDSENNPGITDDPGIPAPRLTLE